MKSRLNKNRGAFTLIELMVVLVIIGLVSTLALTSISGIQRSMAITSSGSQIADYLATARQTAMALNQPIQVWYCPGATNDSFRMYRLSTNGVSFNVAAERELKINERVSLLNNWSTITNIVAAATETNRNTLNCYPFRFMPDGSTDLNITTTDYPTFTAAFRSETNSTTHANFFTIQIDQQTGTTRTFRPQ